MFKKKPSPLNGAKMDDIPSGSDEPKAPDPTKWDGAADPAPFGRVNAEPGFSMEDLREMLGFDRHDERVIVRPVTIDLMGGDFRSAAPPDYRAGNNADTRPVTDNLAERVIMRRAVESVAHYAIEELLRAVEKFEVFNSPHEGYAVIKEELEELWDLVKKNEGHSPQARDEAIQVAAMALRYVLELCEPPAGR